MAHEIAHVGNRDILISSIAATIAGVISYVAFMARWAAIFGGRGRDSGNIVSLLVLAIITPLVATIIQLAISRSREYLADATGARIMQSSSGLASALEKLEAGAKNHPMRNVNQATAHMFIVSPLRGGAFLKLLSTHPPMNLRIQKLRNMKF